MPNGSGEYIDPVENRAPISGLEGSRESGRRPHHHRMIRGRVVAVRGEAPHQDSAHVLDVTVGTSPYTEIVVQTSEQDCEYLQGKSVLITVAEP